jgi:hypothetical protein
MIFRILWPERRIVSAEQIAVWYDDARANGDLWKDAADTQDPHEQALALHDAGLITLARQEA